MSAFQKLMFLGSAGKYDLCSGCAGRRGQEGQHFSRGVAGTLFSGNAYRQNAAGQRDSLFSGGKYRHGAAGNAGRHGSGTLRPPKYDGMIYQASTASGCVPILKTLLTNDCRLDCIYCANPVSQRRASMEPQELARIFHGLWRQGRVRGMFLSSAIKSDPDSSMQKIIECARLVREKYGFSGYVHLKVLPGASRESVRMAAELADRLSINLESPSAGALSEIAPSKDYTIDLLRRQDWIADMDKAGLLRSGHTTQFIVGAAGENDAEILSGLARTYERTGIRRGYFSAFEPVAGTPLEDRQAVSKGREFRLYQSDWLLRVYGFGLSAFGSIFDDAGFLPDEDPKLLLAREFLEPVEPDTAPYSELIKVPGIGPKTARKIIGMRAQASMGKKRLSEAGVILGRALPFLRVGGSVQSVLSDWK